jgi:hypothetical protein
MPGIANKSVAAPQQRLHCAHRHAQGRFFKVLLLFRFAARAVQAEPAQVIKSPV